ncbi:major capsid protein [Streptomyces sp. NPDC126510]|uniref:major capsid protein n=1 Tax=Streptomyces sp. NPDC126510 TaxID=3155317 RepID=UPI00331BC29B
MAEPFQLPEDLSTLSSEDLDATLAAAVEAFNARRQDPNLTTEDLPALRELATGIETLRVEQAERVETAQAAVAELDQLAAKVLGDEAAPEVEEPAEPVEEAVASEVVEEPTPEEVAASILPRRPVIALASVRERQPRQLVPQTAAPVAKLPEIVASVDMPGIAPGEGISMDTLTEGIIRRAGALATSGGGTGIVASYRLPFDDDGLVVKDPGNPAEGLNAVVKAGDQRRLKDGDLVASGGWCAPSETIYEITDIACPDGLWDLPEIQLSRGGIRFFQTPTLDVNAMTWIWTEAQDQAAGAPGGPTKPCFQIPCPTPTEVRCDAVGVCLEAGILTSRHFPELISWYQRNVMIAHEMRIRRALYEQARNVSTPVTTTAAFAAFSAVYGAVALQAVDIQEKHNLCERIGLEVVFPYWMRNMFLADIARQNGVNVCDLNPRCIEDAFATLGIRVQWAKGLIPAVPTAIGGPTPATAWPAEVEFLIYPSGQFQLGRGAEINLGVVHDSTKFATNDFTAIFAEECVALVNRGIEARRVTVDICADGSVGPRAVPACPIA